MRHNTGKAEFQSQFLTFQRNEVAKDSALFAGQMRAFEFGGLGLPGQRFQAETGSAQCSPRSALAASLPWLP
jgi:hypothetical protein